MICKWIIESVLFPGMLLVLIQIFITINPSATTNPTEYTGTLLPGEIIGGWHRVAINHYTFERNQLIGYDHPDDRYRSLKLFWPKEIFPYTRVGRIRNFKCVNKTPKTAKTLMRIISGGIGRSELALEVFYVPVKRTDLIDTLIISCDIYTEANDPGENEDILLLKLFKSHSLGTAKMDEVLLPRTTDGETIEMLDVPAVISETTNRYQAQLERTGWKAGRPVEKNKGERLFDGARNLGSDVANLHTKTVNQGSGATFPYTKSTTLKVSSETKLASFGVDKKRLQANSVISGNEKARRISSIDEVSLKSGKPVLLNRNMNPTTERRIKSEASCEKSLVNETSLTTSGTSLADEFTSETTEQTTDNFEPTTLKIDRRILPDYRTTPASLQTSGLILKTHCNCSRNVIDSNAEENGAKLTQTISYVKSAETSEASSPDSWRSPSVDAATPEDKEDENPNGEETIEKSVTSPWYNLAVNARPKGSRRKMGLAKITYR